MTVGDIPATPGLARVRPRTAAAYCVSSRQGGLFKTTDGGITWQPVTDGQVGGASVGAVAVAESDPDVVYIGMGEVQLRANVLQGDGVYPHLRVATMTVDR